MQFVVYFHLQDIPEPSGTVRGRSGAGKWEGFAIQVQWGIIRSRRRGIFCNSGKIRGLSGVNFFLNLFHHFVGFVYWYLNIINIKIIDITSILQDIPEHTWDHRHLHLHCPPLLPPCPPHHLPLCLWMCLSQVLQVKWHWYLSENNSDTLGGSPRRNTVRLSWTERGK